MLLLRFFLVFSLFSFALRCAPWHIGFDVGVRYAYRSAKATVKTQQTYDAGYDALGRQMPLYSDEAAINNVLGIFHDRTPVADRTNYLLHKRLPERVPLYPAGTRPLGDDMADWLFAVPDEERESVPVGERLLEAEGSCSAAASDVGLELNVRGVVDVAPFLFGCWLGYVHYFHAGDFKSSLSTHVPHETEDVAGGYLSTSITSQAYEPFGFRMVKSPVDVRWWEYGRAGVLLGWNVTPILAVHVRGGVRYLGAELRLQGARVGYPYAHNTYPGEAVWLDGQNKYWVKVAKMLLKGRGFAPVFGLDVCCVLDRLGALTVGLEFSSANIPLQTVNSSGKIDKKASVTLKNPVSEGLLDQSHMPTTWHMTYVENLNLSLSGKMRVVEFAVSVGYTLNL